MPIVAMLGFVGNLFSILVLNSPGVDMKVNTLLVVVLIILIIVLHSSRVDAPLTEGQSSWGVWTRIQMTLWRFEILLEFRAVHKYVIFCQCTLYITCPDIYLNMFSSIMSPTAYRSHSPHWSVDTEKCVHQKLFCNLCFSHLITIGTNWSYKLITTLYAALNRDIHFPICMIAQNIFQYISCLYHFRWHLDSCWQCWQSSTSLSSSVLSSHLACHSYLHIGRWVE